ncbi:MAG: hypothetical protein L0211_19735 [Planctomycetaceae bacterium]|nr:hypothetical protein [Planctomycetaceae bacterium]
MTHILTSSRRQILTAGGAAAVAALAGQAIAAAPAKRPKVAAIFTELRHRSHAYNILTNLMGHCLFRGKRVDPGLDVVSWYADQIPADDMAREASGRLDVPLFGRIQEALCLGGRELAVDAVLLIGEHGEYPTNDLGQKMYPRKEFFDQIVAVMERSGRCVPLFNDKHLSYRWDWTKEMYDRARKLGVPLMAGSSVPLAERRPPLEMPAAAKVVEAVAIHGGGMEVYDFHGLELLESLIESRRGGETGVSRVELVAGEAYGKARAAHRWSPALEEAALAAERSAGFKRQPRPMLRPMPMPAGQAAGDHALLVTYKDGTRAAVLKIGNTSDRWNFACRLEGRDKPLATALFNGPWGNLNLFSALSHAIAHFIRTSKAPYPVERTVLVGGILDAAMHSHHAGRPIDTPHLEFGYEPQDFRAFRETGESWRVVTIDTPQPTKFEPQKP